MDNNHADNYVLVLEDRMEGKNEVEVGKLSVVSNIDEKGKLKSALPKKQPLFYVKQPIALFQGIFSPKHRTLSRKRGKFLGSVGVLLGNVGFIFGNVGHFLGNVGLFLGNVGLFLLNVGRFFGIAGHSAEEKFEVRVGVCCGLKVVCYKL